MKSQCSIVILAVLATVAQAEPAAKPVSGTLFVYCAAGVKAGIEKVAEQFEKETGVKVALSYANSGQLLGQIETSRRGDVYVPGDIGFAAKAEERHLTTGKPRVFCYFVPALYVRKGNPKGIRGVTDLTRPGLKVVLADRSAAIGELQAAIFKTNGVDEAAIQRNVVASPATVIEVALAIKMGTADVGMVWDALASYAPDDAEMVPIAGAKNVIGLVPATVLASSANVPAAEAFLDYLVSDPGRAILRRRGFAVDKP